MCSYKCRCHHSHYYYQSGAGGDGAGWQECPQFGHAGFHISERQPNTDIWKFWMGVLRRQQLHDLNLDLVELLQPMETVVRDPEDKRAAEVGKEETETGDWK